MRTYINIHSFLPSSLLPISLVSFNKRQTVSLISRTRFFYHSYTSRRSREKGKTQIQITHPSLSASSAAKITERKERKRDKRGKQMREREKKKRKRSVKKRKRGEGKQSLEKRQTKFILFFLFFSEKRSKLVGETYFSLGSSTAVKK